MAQQRKVTIGKKLIGVGKVKDAVDCGCWSNAYQDCGWEKTCPRGSSLKDLVGRVKSPLMKKR